MAPAETRGMRRTFRHLVTGTAGLAMGLAVLPVHASSAGPSVLTLNHAETSWTGRAPWPNVAGCQPNDPTCDHHIVVVGDDVDANVWSVALRVGRSDAHVAVYRLDGNNQAVDVIPLEQTIVVHDSSNLTALASSPSGGPIVFAAVPGRYDIAVSGTGSLAAADRYTAAARLCASTGCFDSV